MEDCTRIERATLAYLPSIVDIYNQSVRGKFQTADRTEFSVADKTGWFSKHSDTHPLFVAISNSTVMGWYSLSSYREGREALSGVREISYYVHHQHQHKGIGSTLLRHAIDNAKELGVENLVAIVLEKNVRSISLLKKFQFQQWGFLPSVAVFDGERCGHLYYGLNLMVP